MPIATRSAAKTPTRKPFFAPRELGDPSGFWPGEHSPVRNLDAQIRGALAASLERIQARASHLLPGGTFDLEAVCTRIREGRVSPGAAAAYFELVPALQAGKLELAAACWRRIGSQPVEVPQLRCEPFHAGTLGEDADRYQRLLSIGWAGSQIFAPPNLSEWASFERDVSAALDLLREAVPTWHAELESLLLRIYGAQPAQSDGRGFSGASSRMVWGAIFINVRRHPDRLSIASTVVHEATHQQLFGLSQSQPLTENPPHERYSSPLRNDPRPMDGVYHATYVSARLALFNALFIESPALSPAEKETAEERVPAMRKRFEDGLAIVEKHGKLSPLGRDLLEAASKQLANFLD